MLAHATRRTCARPDTRRCLSSEVVRKVFGDAGSADFLAAAGGPDSIPRLHGLPEVIVTGRANVGKSSLLNAVLGRKGLVHTSSKAGKTRTLNFYRVGREPGKLIVVDAPGYGSRGRPEWGEMFDHYVDSRKELKRIYILFSGKHGLNEMDKLMLGTIITKMDSVRLDDVQSAIRRIREDIFKAAPLCLPPIVTTVFEHPFLGVEDVRASIVDACGVSMTRTS